MPEDLYSELLHIPPGPRPPNYYELLGIPLSEADARVIHAAVLRQSAELKRWALDPDPDRAQRVQEMLNEVNRAGVVLEDPEARRDYLDWDIMMDLTTLDTESPGLLDLTPLEPESPAAPPEPSRPRRGSAREWRALRPPSSSRTARGIA